MARPVDFGAGIPCLLDTESREQCDKKIEPGEKVDAMSHGVAWKTSERLANAV
jgi:hypothetical protein